MDARLPTDELVFPAVSSLKHPREDGRSVRPITFGSLTNASTVGGDGCCAVGGDVEIIAADDPFGVTLVGREGNQRINPMQSKLPRQRVFLQAATVTGQETHLGELYNANLPAAPFPAVVRFAPIASEPSHRS